MAIIVIYSPDQNVQDLLSLNVSTSLLMNPVIRKTPEEVIVLLKKLDVIDMVILDTRKGEENIGKEVSDFLKDRQLKTKLAIIGPKPSDNPDILHAPDVKNWRNIVLEFLQQSGITLDKIKERDVLTYLPIPVRLFRYIKNLPGDVFIQLKSNPFNVRYIKRFNAGEVISPNDYEHLVGKIDNFFVSSEQRVDFVKEISQILMAQMMQPKSVDAKTNEIELFDHQFTLIKMLTSELGVNPEVAILTEKCMDEMAQVGMRQPKLKQYIEDIFISNSAGFQSRLTQLTTVLATTLITFLKMPQTESQIKKMSFTALFHDFLLDEYLLHIRNQASFDQILKDPETKRLVLNHAKASSLYFLNFPNAPDDSIRIIKEHHGSKTGTGFPDKPESGLSALSHIFFISEELAYQLIQHGKMTDLPTILDQMITQYRTEENANYLKALKEVVQISIYN
jgi:hypothetical protein